MIVGTLAVSCPKRTCEVGSNNTAELSAVIEALLWLGRSQPSRATIYHDSDYAAKMTTGEWGKVLKESTPNKELVAKARKVFEEVKKFCTVDFKCACACSC